MKFNNRISILLICLILVMVVSTACKDSKLDSTGDSKRQVVKIGATPGEDMQKKKEQYEPFIKYFEEKTGYKVELFIATDYSSVIEAMRSGEIDIASFGPLSYVLASSVANAEAFATEYKEGLGKFYEAYIITHPDSKIDSIKDLKGKNFAFVDPASTGGYLIPTMEMINNGIDPEKDLGSTIFAGGHDACALAVKNKTIDAAAMVKHMYLKMMEEGLISENDVKIIHTSDPFPASAWAYRSDLDEEIKFNVADAILNMTDEDLEDLKDFLGTTLKYVSAEDSDWNSLREAAELINLDLNNAK